MRGGSTIWLAMCPNGSGTGLNQERSKKVMESILSAAAVARSSYEGEAGRISLQKLGRRAVST